MLNVNGFKKNLPVQKSSIGHNYIFMYSQKKKMSKRKINKNKIKRKKERRENTKTRKGKKKKNEMN